MNGKTETQRSVFPSHKKGNGALGPRIYLDFRAFFRFEWCLNTRERASLKQIIAFQHLFFFYKMPNLLRMLYGKKRKKNYLKRWCCRAYKAKCPSIVRGYLDVILCLTLGFLIT